MCRIAGLTLTLTLLIFAAAPAAACGLGGKWISDARGVTELLIVEGTTWEHYVEFRFLDGGYIHGRSDEAMALFSAQSQTLTNWRYTFPDENTLMLSRADGAGQPFYRLEHCVIWRNGDGAMQG